MRNCFILLCFTLAIYVPECINQIFKVEAVHAVLISSNYWLGRLSSNLSVKMEIFFSFFLMWEPRFSQLSDQVAPFSLSSSISQKFGKSIARGSGRPQLCPVTWSFHLTLSLCQSLELGDPWREPWAWKTQSMASCFCQPASSSSTRPQPY